MLAPNPQADLAPAPLLHDVKIKTRKTHKCARVQGVPPEEFGIERNARSIKDCGYCFHEVTKRQADLIEQKYDAAQIKKLPSYSENQTQESTARDTVEENAQTGDDGINDANRLIRITEHYVKMDYKGEGKACLYRVTTGGEDSEILIRDGEEDVIKIDCIPFAAMTPIIVTHRFVGRSIADLVMDIQRIKTALLRGALDNLYLHNNPRVEVAESYATDNTLDDLLVSRPGGIVRTKQPGGLQWQVVPDITASVYPALQYFDATREWRTGVSRQGQGVDPNALQNQVATIANQMFNASQAKIKLIARIFAETGIRDLFSLLHGTIRRNGSQADTVRLRNKWVNVDPRDWQERNDLTINVGLGDGSKQEKLAGVQLLIGAQEKALQAGMVSADNLYNSAKQLTKLLGYKSADEFFTAPGTQPDPQKPGAAPIPPPENPDIQKAKIESGLRKEEMQGKAQIETLQAQADIATNDRKVQAEIAMADRKFTHDSQLEERRFELEKELKLMEAQISQAEHQQATELKTLDYQNKAAERQDVTKSKSDGDKMAGTVNETGGMVKQLGDMMTEMQKRMADMEAHAASPVELVHDKKTNKVSKIRKGKMEIPINRSVQ